MAKNEYRTMSASCAGYTYYSSAFDQRNGTISRVVDVPARLEFEPKGVNRDRWHREWAAMLGATPGRGGWRHRAFSPSPETVDIQVTNTCTMGCSYCYQSSVPALSHMPAENVEKIIKGFTVPPYQIAFGGGEPCEHPDFASILRNTRKLGVVPNFTTAGYKMPKDVLDAAAKVCGGVALTFHPHYTIAAFKKLYDSWQEALPFFLNVHLVACAGVSQRLRELASSLPMARIVLLAYYPVGRGSMSAHMGKKEYMRDLPEAIKYARKESHVGLSFSEGLFPYFNSRPGLADGVEMSLPAEGRFSCYIDRNGVMTESSFTQPHESATNVYEIGSQQAWLNLYDVQPHMAGVACRKCPRQDACTSPHPTHQLLCAYWEHNK